MKKILVLLGVVASVVAFGLSTSNINTEEVAMYTVPEKIPPLSIGDLKL